MSDRDESKIPRRKLDAMRALSAAKPNLIGELLDDILSEHPTKPNSIVCWYGSPRLAVLDAPGGSKSSATHVSGRNPVAAETSDGYPHVVAMLDDKTRVIAADIQWIVQRRRGRVWDSKYFCRTKAGLLLYARPVTPELLALPDYFPEWPPDEAGA
jgi:hypothetical protein